ncbi:MAG: glutamine-hydrolyzing carbamoyl-phosphate synthase small subunit [Pseudomonadota bacterium]
MTDDIPQAAPPHRSGPPFAGPSSAGSGPSPFDSPVSGALVLADGTVFWGQGLGVRGSVVGEVCFNTSMTGYQEIMTDPSYAGQIITFTFPHVGNVGANHEDMETITPAARGVVLRSAITSPSNWRAAKTLNDWLVSQNLTGLAGIDTRALTARIRDGGAPNGCLVHFDPADRPTSLEAFQGQAINWPGLQGMDLAAEVSCRQTLQWDQTRWRNGSGYGRQEKPQRRVVAVDFGAKHNILRCLADQGCDVTVVPAWTTAEEILSHKPDGIFLSNGPGDPAATGKYAVPAVQGLLETGLPIFGICLGHQILALALGAKTEKMHLGHRGANHPVQDLTTGKVEITSQNHGFVVDNKALPKHLEETHVSLFDGTNEGLRLTDKPVFSVQYHPEASPGPQDSHYLFKRFTDLIDSHKAG